MAKVEFTNGAQITAGHLKISLWIIGGLISLVGTLMLIIYSDFKDDQESRDKKQDIHMEKIYNELVLSTSINTITVEVLKDYLEKRDSVIDFDRKINLKYELLKNKRGVQIEPLLEFGNYAFD